MDNVQIAHDLAVAKLYGSTLSTKEFVSKYCEYLEEFKAELKLRDNETVQTTIINRNMLGI